MKHTPGPWNFKDSSLTIVRGIVTPEDVDCYHVEALATDERGRQRRDSVGYLHRDGGEECEANARLIAAAPDMLEALENIENDDESIPFRIWEMIQNAIRKAKEGK